jgi:hypothetical protein
MDIDEILSSGAFWILTAVGYGAFVIMLMVLKGMEQQSIMPFWVKIATMLIIPILSALFSGYAEG